MILEYMNELTVQNAKLHRELNAALTAHRDTHLAYFKHFTDLRTENENLLAQIDVLDDELDDAYNTIALYEEDSDRELNDLLDLALEELFPEELHDRG